MAWGLVGRSLAILGGSCRLWVGLEESWVVLWRLWGVGKGSGKGLWRNLGRSLGGSWGGLGGSWAGSSGLLGWFWGVLKGLGAACGAIPKAFEHLNLFHGF